jgi:hypothetical protein
LADIIITGPGAQERRYPLPGELTYGEFRTLKALAGIEPAGLEAALTAADAATIMVLAIISAKRAGVEITMDELDGLPFGAVTLEDEDDAERPTDAAAAAPDALPATTPATGGNPS